MSFYRNLFEFWIQLCVGESFDRNKWNPRGGKLQIEFVSSFSYQGLDWAGLGFTEVDHILWQNTPAVMTVMITIVIGELES